MHGGGGTARIAPSPWLSMPRRERAGTSRTLSPYGTPVGRKGRLFTDRPLPCGSYSWKASEAATPPGMLALLLSASGRPSAPWLKRKGEGRGYLQCSGWCGLAPAAASRGVGPRGWCRQSRGSCGLDRCLPSEALLPRLSARIAGSKIPSFTGFGRARSGRMCGSRSPPKS